MKLGMRFFLWIPLVLVPIFDMAQVPEAFNYQAIIRDANGTIIADQNIHLQVSFLYDTLSSTTLYQEQHETATNGIGLVHIEIGNGEVLNGNFSDLDWSSSPLFVQLEMKMENEAEYTHMGFTSLKSVPYAMHAKTVESVNDADADPENELQNLTISNDTIFLKNGGFAVLPTDEVMDADADPENELQDISLDNTLLTISQGSTVDLSSIQDGVEDADADAENELQTLNYEDDSLQISSGNKVLLPIPDTTWEIANNDIFFNKGKVGIGTHMPASKLVVKGEEAQMDDVLFAVVNNSGDTVFCVYQGGVRVFVDDNPSKAVGNKGGFAIGGFNSNKGNLTNEYLRITPDSIRLYVDDSQEKLTGNKGGFAIGGFNSSKGALTNNYLTVSRDSTRVYVNTATKEKGVKGGFAISGLTAKNEQDNNFMFIRPENYFIGHESGQNATDLGIYNSTLGYRSGASITDGSANVFLGYESGLLNTIGDYNVFIGNESGYHNLGGNSNVFVGYQSGYANTSGLYNVFIGNSCGFANTTGERNVFLGMSAGLNNTTGNMNVMIGNDAGRLNTEGYYNVFLGYVSGYSNTTGEMNVFIGNNSGYENTIGNSNVFLGSLSGTSNTEGSSNVYLGNRSGMSNILGSSNVMIGDGSGSGDLATSGSNNVFLGYYSGYTNQASYNTFIGYQTGSANTTGEYNAFLGHNAGMSNTTGSNNVFIGNESGKSNTTGTKNVFMGYFAGYTSNGSNNIAIGDNAGYSLTSGSHNTLIGYASGYKHTDQQYNVMIGTTAGYHINASGWSGSFNTFIGINAGYGIEYSRDNTFIGTNAGFWLENGQGNTFVGIDAGRAGNDHTWVSGSKHANYNSFFGCQAGRNMQSGNYNVALGYAAGYANESGSSNIFIGYQAGFNETGSNKLYIENSNSASPLIYGDFDANTLQVNGSVGVGKSASYALDVNGDININNGYNFKVDGVDMVSSPWLSSGSNIYFSAGNVAIGTSPDASSKLKIDGDVAVAGNMTIDTVTAAIEGTVNSVQVQNFTVSASSNIVHIYSDSFVLVYDETDPSLWIENNHASDDLSYWFQGQNGATTTGNTGDIAAGGKTQIVPLLNDNDGYHIHFGDLVNGDAYCDIWLQFFHGRLVGHYLKYDQ